MSTLKRSSLSAKSGKPDRLKGLSHFSALLAKANEDGDRLAIIRYEAIIKRLERLIKDEKEK